MHFVALGSLWTGTAQAVGSRHRNDPSVFFWLTAFDSIPGPMGGGGQSPLPMTHDKSPHSPPCALCHGVVLNICPSYRV